MRRDRQRALKVVLLTAVGTTALAFAVAPAGAQMAEPDEWADEVCSTAINWADALDSAGDEFNEADTPEEAADALDAAVDETTAVIRTIRRAGRPNVDGGKAARRGLVRLFRDARTVMEEAAAEAGDLPDEDGLSDGKADIDEQIGSGLSELGPDLDAVYEDADAELQAALEDDSSCQAVFGFENGSGSGEE
jgi:hypothetical protein